MRSLNIDWLPKRKEYHFLKVGDIHIGAMNCDKVAFEETMVRLKNDRNAWCVLMGDQLDAILYNDKRYNPLDRDTELLSFQDQIEWLYKTVKPVKKKILGVLEGNHEEKVTKRVGYDFTERFADDLGSEYLHQISMLNFDLPFRKLSSLVAHGIGGGTTIGGQINKIKKLIHNFETSPDIISVGHYHKLDSFKVAVLDKDMKTKIKYIGLTGTYYRAHVEGTSNYAVKKWYSPSLIGYLEYQVTPNGIQVFERVFE